MDMENIFKAGDFTSGKMAEIFKSCFFGGDFGDLAIINHKQFGTAYLIPEDSIRIACTLILNRSKSFQNYMNYCDRDGDFWTNEEEAIFHFIGDYYEDHVNHWDDVLRLISKRGTERDECGMFLVDLDK